MHGTPHLYKDRRGNGGCLIADGNTDNDVAKAGSPEQGGEDKSEPKAKLRSGGRMSRAEAGRLGGMKTKERHGEDHFRRIGRAGGSKGGATTRDRYGVEHYKKIGSLGGKK